MSRGFQFGFAEKYDAQIDEMKKAVDLNPNAGPAYNQLGYAYLAQGNAAAAVDPLKKYASLALSEPNPQDSLGEALLANGQFAEAEAAFRKATSLSPTFSVAWEGVAYSKMFGRDWAGGKEAVAKAKEAASRPADRITAERLGAFGTLAEGKSADGLKQLDALAKSPDASPLDVAVCVGAQRLGVRSNRQCGGCAKDSRSASERINCASRRSVGDVHAALRAGHAGSCAERHEVGADAFRYVLGSGYVLSLAIGGDQPKGR
jgi:tetratricopeptide (TPR) repeat protein